MPKKIAFCIGLFTFLCLLLPTHAADDVVIYGSVERSEAWETSSQYATGYRSVSLLKDFQVVGATQKSPTVTDGAVYVDGYCYYLKKTYASVVRYSLDFCKMNAKTWAVERTIAKGNGTLSLANDMTYDATTQTVYAASPRAYGTLDTDLRTVDLTTGEFTTVAPMAVCIRAIAADSKGQLWGLGTEVVESKTTTFLYRIDKATGALTKVGSTGFNMAESETGMAFDLRDDRLYWTAYYYEDDELLQRTYKSGIVEINTTTGQGTLLKAFTHNEKVVGMFINTDEPNGPATLKPKSPSSLSYNLTDRDRSVTLSWAAPTLCEDERTPIDAAGLTYSIRRLTDNKVVAEGVTTTSYTDTPPYQMQRTAYTITAHYASEQSEAVRTESFICGQPFAIPYLETFDREANFNGYTNLDVNADSDPINGGTWYWDYNNQAVLYYTNFHQANDWLITPFIQMPTDRVLRLRFGTHGYLGTGATKNHLQVTIGAHALPEEQTRMLIDTTYVSTQAPLWLTSLFVPQGEECRIGFHNISDGSDHMYIDNIYVVDYGPLTIPSAPNQTRVYKKADYGVDISTYTPRFDAAGQAVTGLREIRIYRGGNSTPFAVIPCTQPDQMVTWHDADAAVGLNTYILTAVNGEGEGLEATVTFFNENPDVDDDLDEGINDDVPLLPYVTDLRLAANGHLTWGDATTYPALHHVTDSIETLTPFSIKGGEGWTTADRDGARTIGITTGNGTVEWPHATEAQGFIVFRPSAVGLQELIPTRSGSQCFIAFSSAGRPNDDWLISPQLSGDEQYIAFYAKCVYPENLNERFEIWVSDTDNRPESFHLLSNERPVTSATEWQRIMDYLPKGTRHFAIRCVSNNQFGLMIDDIRYVPAYPVADLLGYNIYADGTKQNSTLVEDNDWEPTVDGTYTISAVYTQGESLRSNSIDVINAGIQRPTMTGHVKPTLYNAQGQRTSDRQHTHMPMIRIDATLHSKGISRP